jgi:hypothetical protein
VSVHKCRHCGDDIRSVRLWLPRPPDWPGGILTPPPFDTAYESLEDGGRFCRDTSDVFAELGFPDLVGDTEKLAHQPMPRIRT